MLARLLIVVLVVASGCGYHFVGGDLQLPEDVHSIGVGNILNHTTEHGLEKTLGFAIEREIHIRGHYRLEQDADHADAVLSGLIKRLDRRPVAYDEKDQAVIYELALVVDLNLVRKSDNKTLWRLRNFKKVDEYSANPRIVVTSSSEFQRGTLDAKDLPRATDDAISDTKQISAIQLADSERQRAIARLLGDAVHDAYDSMIEGF